jgi:hypothetical protein
MANPISENDLDSLFGDILAGLEGTTPDETEEKKEAKTAEEMAGNENMTQEQIDALIKEMLGG